jgi:hypothetical protein
MNKTELTQDSMKITLADDIIKLYLRGGYGKVLRSEIDTVVFHYFLMNEVGDPPSYFTIDKEKIFELSTKLKLSESRFKRLLDDDYTIYNKDDNNKDNKDEISLGPILSDIIRKRGLTKESFKNGKLCLNISNPIVKKLLDVEMYKKGGIIDYSFNNEKIVIEVYDFLRLFNDDKTIIEELNRVIRSKKKLTPEGEKFLNEVNEKNLSSTLKKIAGGVLSGVLGKAGEELVEVGFDIVSKVILYTAGNKS